jgi:1-acyl-sn-glycerol-3-phosphate acyltransferase
MIEQALVAWTRLLVGAQGRWATPNMAQSTHTRIYFSNHTSHLDTLAIWAALPVHLRHLTRPVAAKDYWGCGGIRQFFADRALHALYIDREHGAKEGQDPLAPLREALAADQSLIIFPEGTRGQARLPAPFKSGLFHLAQAYPEVELIPTYLDTLHRSMPKGCLLPLPFICTVKFGEPLGVVEGETKESFLQRAHAGVIALAGSEIWG